MVVEVMSMHMMTMEVTAMKSEADERPDEAGTEVMMMVPPAETAAVDLLNQRGRLSCLQRHAANGRSCRRGRHRSEAECTGHRGEQYGLPHVCLLHAQRAPGVVLGQASRLTRYHWCALQH
jgi:hypothetical protein